MSQSKPTAIVQRQATLSLSTSWGFIISKIFTQNAHDLRCCPCNQDGNIHPHDPHDYTRYEHLIATMKLKQLNVYFVQETWLEGDIFDEIINGYHVFCHNGKLGNHTFCSIAIILSLLYHEGWKAAGAWPPTTTNANGKFMGRFISINITLAGNNRVGKQVQGKQGNKQLSLTLASIYHPCTKTGNNDTYLWFLDTLDALLSHFPAKLEISIGTDINSNTCTLDDLHSTKFCSAIGPHGLPKRNKKGENLLYVNLVHRLRVMNTFFKAKLNSPGHSTWTSNRPTSSGIADTHMLNVVVCSASLHKRIHNCCTTLDGLDSNHCAVSMDLNLTSIKYKAKLMMNCGNIDWRKICEEDEQSKLYNKYLLELTSWDMSYNNFCKAVVCAGKETAVAIDHKCEGWYMASKSILAPAIQVKNRLHYRLHNRSGLSPDEVTSIQAQLKVINKRNHDLVELAKACW
jgi:hypothetical protein